MSMIRCAFVPALVAAGLGAASIPAAAVADPGFSALYVFGDSLSDSGNLYHLTGNTVPPPPYFQGRFSNGPVAVEYLRANLGIALMDFHNFAIAGATTGTDGQLANTGLLVQVDGFVKGLNVSNQQADGQALYAVWAGANDFLHGDLTQWQTIVSTAVGNLTSSVTALYDKGARSFLLPLMPDLGATPRALALDVTQPGTASFLTFLSTVFHDQLASAYVNLAANWSDEHFYVFDTFTAQHQTLAAAATAGKNTTQPCFDVSVPSVCADYGANYYYFDDIHPTTATHEILGSMMAAQVPEPQTMLMLAVGVGFLLSLKKRR